MKPNAPIINPRDSVAVVLQDILWDDKIKLPLTLWLTAVCGIRFSHKMARRDLEKKERNFKNAY